MTLAARAWPLLNNRFAETLGWTLAHSLWQIALIAALVAVGLWCCRKTSANARYLLACFGLILFTAAPVATYFYLLPPAPRHPMDMVALQETLTAPQILPAPAAVERPAAAPTLTPPPPAAVRLPLSFRTAAAVRPLLPYALVLYFSGVFLLALRMAIGYWRLHALFNAAAPVTASVRAQLSTLLAQLRMARPVRVLESALVEVPTLMGALRPVILVPVSAFTGISADQLSALLAHELAHIRRHDYLANLVQSVLETLLFYHPAVWWLSARIRQEREHCCDDAAIATTGNRITYATALAAMESLRHAPRHVPASLAVAAGGGVLLPRIRRILGIAPAPAPLATSFVALFLVALLSALIYVGCTATPSAPPSTPHLTDDSPKNVRIEAYYVLASDDALQSLAPRWNLSLPATLSETKGTPVGPDNPARTPARELTFNATLVTKDALTQLLAALRNDKQTTLVAAPQALLFNRIPGTITVTEQQNYIRGNTKTAAGNNFDIATLSTGLTLNLEAAIAPDQRTIQTTLHPKFTTLDGIDTFTVPGDANPGVQLPRISSAEFNLSAAIPDDATLLIAGPKIGKGNRTLLVLLRPTLTAEISLPFPPAADSPGTGPKIHASVIGTPHVTPVNIALESRVLMVSSNFLDDFRFGSNLTLPAGLVGGNVSGTAITNGNTFAQAIPGSSGTPGLVASLAQVNLSASIIDDWTLNLILTATQADKRTFTATAPHVIYSDGQAGIINVTDLTNVSFTSRQSRPAGNSAPATRPTTRPATNNQNLDLGLTVKSSADRRYIFMTLAPTISAAPVSPTSQHSAPSPDAPDTENRVVPGASPATMLSIPDGGTLLIGGPVTNPGTPQAAQMLLLIRPTITTIALTTAPAQPSAPSAQPITFDTELLTIPINFFDEFRLGWNLAIPLNRKNAPASPTTEPFMADAAIIDNWTRDLILKAVNEPKRSVSARAPLMLADGQKGLLTAPVVELALKPLPGDTPATTRPVEAYVNLSAPITARLSADGRFIVVTLDAPAGGNGNPAGAGTPNAAPVKPATTLTLPIGGTLLLKGPVLSPGTPEAVNTLILVRPTITKDAPATAPAYRPAPAAPGAQLAPEESRQAVDERLAALKAAPQQNVTAYIAEGNKLYETAQYKEAAYLLRQAVAIDPEDKQARLLLRLVQDKITARQYEAIVHRSAADAMRQNVDSPDAAVRDTLEQPLKEIAVDGQGLQKVITLLGNNMGVKIFVNWTALKSLAIDRDTPTSITLRDVPFRKALTALLDKVGKDQLGYVIEDDMIIIDDKSNLPAPTTAPASAAPALQSQGAMLEPMTMEAIRRDRAITLYQNAQRSSDEALGKKQFPQAIARAQDAIAILDQNLTLFSDPEAKALHDAGKAKLDNATKAAAAALIERELTLNSQAQDAEDARRAAQHATPMNLR